MRDDDVMAVYEAINRLNQVVLRPEVRVRFLGPELAVTSVADILLMRSLAQVGPIRLSDLATYQGVDKSTISPQIARLDESGLILRRPDPSDGRASLVRLSPKGRGLLQRIRSRAGRVYGEATRGWSDDDLAVLAGLTVRLADAFEKLAVQEG